MAQGGGFVAAGWYHDPAGMGQRYWDGNAWTHNVAPLPIAAPAATPFHAEDGPVASTGDWIGGVLLSLIIPVIGLIAGIIYVARGGQRARCGWMIIVLSALACIFWGVTITTNDESQTTYYYPGPTQQQTLPGGGTPQIGQSS